MTKPKRSPSGTSTVLMKPRCSVQNGSTGSILSTNRTGVSFLTGMANLLAQLARGEPRALYKRIGQASGRQPDYCVLDVFPSAVGQARSHRPPAEQSLG